MSRAPKTKLHPRTTSKVVIGSPHSNRYSNLLAHDPAGERRPVISSWKKKQSVAAGVQQSPNPPRSSKLGRAITEGEPRRGELRRLRPHGVRNRKSPGDPPLIEDLPWL